MIITLRLSGTKEARNGSGMTGMILKMKKMMIGRMKIMNEDTKKALERIKEAISKSAIDVSMEFKKIKDALESISASKEERNMIELGTIPRGGLFDTKLGRFQVLDHDRAYGFTKVIQYDFYESSVEFDNNSCDYLTSSLRAKFDGEITKAYEEVFGDALIEHTTEIISVDMRKYGELTAKVRPITFDEAREFNELIVKNDIGDWWWTCSPWSIEGRGYKNSVAVVSPSGYFISSYCGNGSGVRPFCILKSNIFVSEVEELG